MLLEGSATSGQQVLLRLPVLADPGRWSTSAVTLLPGSTTVTDSGWTVLIQRIVGPSESFVSPSTIPTDNIFYADKAYAGYVILPEKGSFQQYWVPVTRAIKLFDKCYAQLNTPEFSVTFFRDDV